jgi:HlyD family secretion protein
VNERGDVQATRETRTDSARDAAAGSLSDRVRALRLPQAQAAEPGWRRWLPWALCLVLALSTAALVFRGSAQPEAETAPPPEKGTSRPTVADQGSIASSGDVVLESKGYVIAVHQIQVSPKVSGMVMELYFQEGQRVKQGEKLAQLEIDDYRDDRDRAKATLESAQEHYLELKNGNRPEEIESAKADLAECEAQLEQLFLEWKRNVGLKTGNALAIREYEQAYSAYKAMDRRVHRLRETYKLMVEGPRKERIAAAQADVRQAQADLRKAQWRLDNCTICAPVSGTILTKKAEKGNIVNSVAFNVSASLCDLADLSDLEVELNIQERDIAKVFKGQNCRIRPEAFPERAYIGVVSRLMPMADRAKGAVPVRVKIDVPKEEEGIFLKPDMGAVVAFLKKS